MAYIGNQIDTGFTSLLKQDLTGASGTTLTLSHAVANENDIALYINNVRQEPISAYTVSNVTVNLTGTVSGTDDIYVIYLARAVQTTVPPDSSVTSAKLDTNISISGTLGVTGALTPSAGVAIPNGQGIDFSASSNASGMTSELLDKYEEGTWTALIKSSGGSSITTVNTGTYYVRIGTLVNCWFYIKRTDSSNPGGNLRIAGLPFTSKSTNYASMSGAVWIDNDDSAALDRRVFLYLAANSTEAVVLRTGTTSDFTTLSELGNNRFAYGYISYLTD